MSFLQVNGVSKYERGNLILNKVDLSLKPFRKLVVAGETGSGKSTFLKIIAGLVQPSEGEVFFEQQKVLGPDEKLLPGHPHIAYLSQYFELRNNYRVEELLEYANKLSEKEASTIYRICRIDHLLKRKSDQLSGGEKQRIATARLLLTSPRLFLLDEPFSNLDAIHKRILKEVIRDMSEKLAITCVIISHDPPEILSWADEIIVLKEGRIIQHGAPETVYTQPVNEYAAALFGNYNKLTPHDAASLFGINIHATEGQHLFVRPEYLKLGLNGAHSVRGIISEVDFYGSYVEVKVKVNDSILQIKTDQMKRKVGEAVFVSLPLEGIWLL